VPSCCELPFVLLSLSDPDSDLTAVALEPDLESGSRLAKYGSQTRKKFINFMFEELSGGVKRLNVPFRGL
jgi:hypothetical protein